MAGPRLRMWSIDRVGDPHRMWCTGHHSRKWCGTVEKGSEFVVAFSSTVMVCSLFLVGI